MRRTSLSLMVIICLALPVAAQEDATGEKITTKIFRIEHADVNSIAGVISVFRGRVQPNPDLGVIAWTGSVNDLAGVEAAIKSLDVAPLPEPNVELTVYFIKASKGRSESGTVPAALDGVATQLKDVFGYDTVTLIETTAMRARHGSGGKINGILPQRLADDREARYEFFFDRIKVTEDSAGRSIRLDGLNAGVQAPHTVVVDGKTATRYMQTGIRTDIDLREGQKAVIGKTSIEGGAETIFVVVTGTIIE